MPCPRGRAGPDRTPTQARTPVRTGTTPACKGHLAVPCAAWASPLHVTPVTMGNCTGIRWTIWARGMRQPRSRIQACNASRRGARPAMLAKVAVLSHGCAGLASASPQANQLSFLSTPVRIAATVTASIKLRVPTAKPAPFSAPSPWERPFGRLETPGKRGPGSDGSGTGWPVPVAYSPGRLTRGRFLPSRPATAVGCFSRFFQSPCDRQDRGRVLPLIGMISAWGTAGRVGHAGHRAPRQERGAPVQRHRIGIAVAADAARSRHLAGGVPGAGRQRKDARPEARGQGCLSSRQKGTFGGGLPDIPLRR